MVAALSTVRPGSLTRYGDITGKKVIIEALKQRDDKVFEATGGGRA